MDISIKIIRHSYIYVAFIILVFILYGNAINNEYSLDDNIVVDGNPRVEDGFKAIPSLFKSRYSINEKQEYAYRPLVLISFAIEKQFFGKLPPFQTVEQKKKIDSLTQANISHFVNVCLYLITCILLFNLLVQVFPKKVNVLLPTLTVFFFLIHPLHTEVVVNIKSRDELLMFLFLVLSLKYYIHYATTNKIKYLIIAPFFFILSMLSKKNGIAVVGILPIIYYYKKISYKKLIVVFGTFLIVWVCFVLMKKGLLSGKSFRELQYFENPLFFEGDFLDRIAVGIYCSIHYLKMLIFPMNLSYYYGYNVIPMVTFKNWEVWLGLLLFTSLSVYGVKRLYKRKIDGLGIVLWMGLMLMVVNIIIPMVGIVADRFTYMFSLGYCIVLAYYLLKLFKVKENAEEQIITIPKGFVVTLLIIGIFYSGRTIARNPDWHDYLTLYKNDIKHLKESAKANALISNVLYVEVIKELRNNPNNIKSVKVQENIRLMQHHYHEAIRIDSSYVASLNNLGSLYINLKNEYEQGVIYCKEAMKYSPNHEDASINIATAYDKLGMVDSAFVYYIKSIEINPQNYNYFNSLNILLIENNMIDVGIKELKKIAKNTEQPKYLFNNIANLLSLNSSRINEAIEYFEKSFQCDTSDLALCKHLVMLHSNYGDKNKANYYLTICP